MEQAKNCLGVDWGEKRIGLALGDTETGVSTPWKTVHSPEQLLEAIEQEQPDIVVVGAPYKYSNSSELSPEFQGFFQELRKNIQAEVVTVDERLTSKEADTLPGDKRTKAGRDSMAAMLVLQQYLNENNER